MVIFAICGPSPPAATTCNSKRGLHSAAIGAQLVLNRVLQLADAIFNLLPQWLRHPRQLRDRSTWGTRIAWMRTAASPSCRNTLRPRATARSGQDDYRNNGRRTPRRRHRSRTRAWHARCARADEAVNPAVPKTVRYRETGDIPDPPRHSAAIGRLPRRMACRRGWQPAARLADVRPPRICRGTWGSAAYSKRLSAATERTFRLLVPDRKLKDQGCCRPKAVDGPKVAEGSSPEPAQPASSTSRLQVLPASCWSGGASRWQWWASSQGNPCK